MLDRQDCERDAAWHDDLVHRHQGLIMSMLQRRLGLAQIHAAQDLAQRTFMTAWEKRAVVPDEPGAWLARTALNHLSNHRRWGWLRRQEMAPESVLEAEVATEPPPEHVLDARRALARLSKAERELLWLSYVEEFSSDEVGAILGISPAAARKRLARAAHRLRQHLGADYLSADHIGGEVANRQ